MKKGHQHHFGYLDSNYTEEFSDPKELICLALLLGMIYRFANDN